MSDGAAKAMSGGAAKAMSGGAAKAQPHVVEAAAPDRNPLRRLQPVCWRLQLPVLEAPRSTSWPLGAVTVDECGV